jgi:hypothetical protein
LTGSRIGRLVRIALLPAALLATALLAQGATAMH